MRTFTRIVTAGLFASAAVLTVVPVASAAEPDWCSVGAGPCTAPPPGSATADGWCVLPGSDICRRY
ncbi:hypothetical protein [Amycolatopsis sp. lyj-109]|uniref:hypothetical protein n=1 Tax=Amycolatopsis sp. lyj-109 TaxID=2789287 RepID=UPI00397AD492